MSNKDSNGSGLSLPLAGMLILGVSGAITVAACFEVIKYWPQPVSVDPYFGGNVGLFWGLIVGAATGLIIGFLTDDKHFGQKPSDYGN